MQNRIKDARDAFSFSVLFNHQTVKTKWKMFFTEVSFVYE